MKRINNILLIILLAFVFSCNAKKRVSEVPVHTTTKIVERMVPVAMPQDSSMITALFECDSNNRVILQQLHEAKTSRIASSYTLTNGVFAYKTKTVRDTIHVVSRDTIITQEKPIHVIQEVNKLTRIQLWLVWIGVSFLLLVVYRLIRLFI